MTKEKKKKKKTQNFRTIHTFATKLKNNKPKLKNLIKREQNTKNRKKQKLKISKQSFNTSNDAKCKLEVNKFKFKMSPKKDIEQNTERKDQK